MRSLNFAQHTGEEDSCLHVAVRKNDLDEVLAVLADEIDIDAVNRFGCTALWLAADGT